MTPERYRRLFHLFEAALERKDAERSDLLDKECASDGELRHEVEALLASALETDQFLKLSGLQGG